MRSKYLVLCVCDDDFDKQSNTKRNETKENKEKEKI